MASNDKPMGLTDILEQIRESTSDQAIELGDVVKQLQSRGFGPILLAPALIALLPTGAIPGVPSACGIMIFLVAIQMVFGQTHPWLPKKLKQLEFSRERFTKATSQAKPYTQKIDRWLRPRLNFLTDEPFNRITALACALIGLAMIPLELVPFAAAVPALAIALAAIALSTKDGILMVIASVVFIIALYLLINNFLLG